MQQILSVWCDILPYYLPVTSQNPHVIEHMPDLFGFMRDCEALLKPNGVLTLAIPTSTPALTFCNRSALPDRSFRHMSVATVAQAAVRCSTTPPTFSYEGLGS